MQVPADYVVTNRRGKVLGPRPPPFMDDPEYGLHEHTIDQEERTLHNRHLFATPEPDLKSKAWLGFKRHMRALSRLVGKVPRASCWDIMHSRSSMKRRRFGGGMEKYCRDGVRRQDSFLTEMQKLEFYAEDKLESKEDRGIQFRNPTYNAALSRHLHHVEKRLYSRARNSDGTPQIAKGRSPLERGMILAAMAQEFVKPRFITMDHSRFDAHVNKWLLSEEHKFYLRARHWHKELVDLLKWQEQNIGFSHGGIVYRIKAKRASGDMNTGLGNSVINLALILSWLEANGITKYRIFLDGDDSVVIIEEDDAGCIDTIPEHMAKCGMVTEVGSTSHIEHAEFCQSRICWGELGPIMVRNPFKTLDVLTKSPRVLDDVQARGVLAASALGELMQAPGVPIIAPAASRLLTFSGANPKFTTPDAYERFLVYRAGKIIPIVDDSMRESFAFAWGIPISDQLAAESYYAEVCPPTTEIPKIKPPKSKDIVHFQIWDDVQYYEPPHDEYAWWKNEWPVGDLLGPLSSSSSHCVVAN